MGTYCSIAMFGGELWSTIVMIIALGVMAFLIISIMLGCYKKNNYNSNAKNILRERYVKGEVNKKEFETMFEEISKVG